MTTRILILTGWLLLAVAGVTYHLTAGPSQQRLDLAAERVKEAEKAAADKDYAEVVTHYQAALAALPEGRTADARKIRLEKAKAQMLAKQLPDAHADLKVLVEELTNDPAADPKMVADARSAMANANYYITWLMRLEGLPREAWEPEAEAARQTYKLLAEQSEATGDSESARRHKEDLESAVRLARMDLGELQGLPLPSQ